RRKNTESNQKLWFDFSPRPGVNGRVDAGGVPNRHAVSWCRTARGDRPHAEPDRTAQRVRALRPSPFQWRGPSLGPGPLYWHRKPAPHSISAPSHTEVCAQRWQRYNDAPQRPGRNKHLSSTNPGTPARSGQIMTKLITIPKFAELTGLPYRLC